MQKREAMNMQGILAQWVLVPLPSLPSKQVESTPAFPFTIR